MGDKFRIHPLLVTFFMYLLLTEQYAFYSLYIVTLLVHESGHVLFAKLCRIPIRSCVFHLYGAELDLYYFQSVGKWKKSLTILGGPLFTLVFIFVIYPLEFLGQSELMKLQVSFLLINLLPFFPLDGGQMIRLFLTEHGQNRWSVISIFVPILCITLSFVPIPLKFFFLFVAIQNLKRWQFRKYEASFNKFMQSRLTV
ncbi:hypothetical protein D3873_07485 [Paenisporosarcina cavernae]|uniref:Stage IV sporulation protein FB n=1 Tax=Paenisporosarcina cavernae TaxID=2320858 RepID=A0A385YT99_9BACL|nr:hypothetical protein D3873_07485 [Paenisporosarcina cavernae]